MKWLLELSFFEKVSLIILLAAGCFIAFGGFMTAAIPFTNWAWQYRQIVSTEPTLTGGKIAVYLSFLAFCFVVLPSLAYIGLTRGAKTTGTINIKIMAFLFWCAGFAIGIFFWNLENRSYLNTGWDFGSYNVTFGRFYVADMNKRVLVFSSEVIGLVVSLSVVALQIYLFVRFFVAPYLVKLGGQFDEAQRSEAEGMAENDADPFETEKKVWGFVRRNVSASASFAANHPATRAHVIPTAMAGLVLLFAFYWLTSSGIVTNGGFIALSGTVFLFFAFALYNSIKRGDSIGWLLRGLFRLACAYSIALTVVCLYKRFIGGDDSGGLLVSYGASVGPAIVYIAVFWKGGHFFAPVRQAEKESAPQGWQGARNQNEISPENRRILDEINKL